MFVNKSLSLKKYFERKNSQTKFCCLCVNLPTVKIWGQLDKFPMNSTFLQCPLQVKKLIRENSAKYFNQTGNFYFRSKLKTAISLPIFNLFQWFLFYIRDFNWIITWPQNRNLKKIVDLKVYCNLKVAQKRFQHFPRCRFWRVIITTLYQLMLQSWYQKPAQSLVNTLVLFLQHNRLP